MLVSEVAPRNTLSLMEVSTLPVPKVSDVSDVVPWNARLPIEVTLAGIEIEISDEAPLNALAAIEVAVSGRTMSPVQELPAETTLLVIV